MKLKEIIPKIKLSRYAYYLNKNMLKSIVIFSGGMILFIFGCIIYGVVLNIGEDSLRESMRLKGFRVLREPNLLIDRSSYTLSIYEDTVFIKSYRASFGKNVTRPKSKNNDGCTPVGEYAICSIDSSHKYYKFLQLNYPNLNDASEALRFGIINQRQFDQIKFDYYYAGCVNPESPLGGSVGIHGIGEYNYFFKNLPFVYNWTDGSIAVSNESIDEISSVIKKGTKVVIK
jgi:murein L,D-transpeptidase YafK